MPWSELPLAGCWLPGGSTDARLAQAAALRQRVFVGEQGVAPDVEADDLDREPTTTHFALWAQGDVLATGRLLDPGGPLALGRVGRMAVDPSARGRTYGHTVLRALESSARERGLVGIELHAQAHAERFYTRHGYTVTGPPFVEQGIEHLPMQVRWLPGLRPVRDEDAAGVQDLVGGVFAEYDGCVLDLDREGALDSWMLAPASTADRTVWVLPGEADGLDACVGVGPADPDGARGRRELKSLYVRATARGSGRGALLVHLAERAGADHLWTDTRFSDAHRLYARLRWTDTGERRDLHDPSGTTEARWVRGPSLRAP